MKKLFRLFVYLVLACLVFEVYVHFTKDLTTAGNVSFQTLPFPSPGSAPLGHLHSEKDARNAIRNRTGFTTTVGISHGALLARSLWEECGKEYGAERKTYNKMTTPSSIFSHILVEETHKILYCYIPKVACSNWRKVLLVLSGRINASQMTITPVHDARAMRWLPRLSTYRPSEIQHRLDTYFKFMMVREPLERLLSAWRDKFQGKSTKSIKFRRGTVQRIIKEYPEVRNRLKPGYEVDSVTIQFEEFLQYITDQSSSLNQHWETFHKLCHPCTMHYDFVGKLETVEEDAAYVLSKVHGDDEVSFPERSASYKLPPSTAFVDNYYRTVSVSLLKQVLALYMPDFTYFNYSMSKYQKLIG